MRRLRVCYRPRFRGNLGKITAIYLILLWSSLPVAAQETVGVKATSPIVKPPSRDANIPNTRWSHLQGTDLWTRSALSALKAHGAPLVTMVPRDIAQWCPAYATASETRQRAFWVGFLSALAKHESTYQPWAVGGNGRWFGLVQISPATARGYGCRARSGAALKHGPSNLSCAIRIMAKTVPRDGVVSRLGKGVAADWGPLVSSRKRSEMQAWTRSQPYCTALSTIRPQVRPEQVSHTALRPRPQLRPERLVLSDQ